MTEQTGNTWPVPDWIKVGERVALWGSYSRWTSSSLQGYATVTRLTPTQIIVEVVKPRTSEPQEVRYRRRDLRRVSDRLDELVSVDDRRVWGEERRKLIREAVQPLANVIDQARLHGSDRVKLLEQARRIYGQAQSAVRLLEEISDSPDL